MNIMGLSITVSRPHTSALKNLTTAESARKAKYHGLPIVPTSPLGFLVLGYVKSEVSEKKPSMSKK